MEEDDERLLDDRKVVTTSKARDAIRGRAQTFGFGIKDIMKVFTHDGQTRVCGVERVCRVEQMMWDACKRAVYEAHLFGFLCNELWLNSVLTDDNGIDGGLDLGSSGGEVGLGGGGCGGGPRFGRTFDSEGVAEPAEDAPLFLFRFNVRCLVSSSLKFIAGDEEPLVLETTSCGAANAFSAGGDRFVATAKYLSIYKMFKHNKFNILYKPLPPTGFNLGIDDSPSKMPPNLGPFGPPFITPPPPPPAAGPPPP